MQFPPKQRAGLFLLLLVVPLVVSAATPSLPPPEPAPLDVYLFASSTCLECRAIKQELLPRLKARYGTRVRFRHVQLDDLENFKLLLLYEKRYGVTDDEALKLFVRDTFLSG